MIGIWPTPGKSWNIFILFFMKKLELKELSVQEMNEKNGGWILQSIAFMLTVELVADGWDQCKQDFLDGYNGK